MNKITKSKLFKIPATLALAAGILYVAPVTSHAAEGGWTEGEGSWISENPSQFSIMATKVAKKPQKHTASFNYKVHTTYVAKQVVAHTEWKDAYHYSRARFEGSFGRVEGDSKRVWGTGSTTAKSEYIDPVAVVAKTYWGN
ncbi:hypothetical protein CEQ21_04710 [Niallia circulans]|uniref:Lactococcin 972 family bacteriocin n=1 Tax=Niallia circulans TaxID=1397 RepID=A0A553STA8_NIACI|nr:hypothetical protein [Niallia circulans]TRZ40243.1 hypothetical protein CEQ21_04710 [Niallia circulans]